MQLDLPTEHRKIVEELLARHLPGVEVWAYGSRVAGTCHECSDLDLAARGAAPIPAGTLTRIRSALRESSLPIEVEVRDWRRMPREFREEIEHEHVVLQRAG